MTFNMQTVRVIYEVNGTDCAGSFVIFFKQNFQLSCTISGCISVSNVTFKMFGTVIGS